MSPLRLGHPSGVALFSTRNCQKFIESAMGILDAHVAFEKAAAIERFQACDCCPKTRIAGLVLDGRQDAT